ncbi:MAG: type II toxin-antitoxin system VapC family toxin [bacterium]|nr:type II toxin-antitoxin system VapC family toxin [bacterium]
MDTHSYLLDTNILSHLIRNPTGTVFNYLNSILPATACTSIIVSAEIRFGLCKGASEKLQIQAKKVLGVLDILPLKRPVDEHYGQIRAFLNQAGKPIGGNDLLIAAHALTLNLTLVTANVREFTRVPNLRVENWLE